MTDAREGLSPESMSFLEHLEDLRKMLLRCAAALLIGMIAAIPMTPMILDWLKAPLELVLVQHNVADPDKFLQIFDVMGGFKVAVSVVFWSGLLIATPFMVFFIAAFVFPGLHASEKKVIRRSSIFAVLLFFTGAMMGYYGTIGHALQTLLFGVNEWLGLEPEMIRLTDYVAFVIKLILGFGLAFQLPLVLLALGVAGVVEPNQLQEKRRHVVVGLLVMAMLLTPPEPVSQLMMAGTLYLLYEVCILILRIRGSRD